MAPAFDHGPANVTLLNTSGRKRDGYSKVQHEHVTLVIPLILSFYLQEIAMCKRLIALRYCFVIAIGANPVMEYELESVVTQSNGS